jgi:hypothetical protein
MDMLRDTSLGGNGYITTVNADDKRYLQRLQRRTESFTKDLALIANHRKLLTKEEQKLEEIGDGFIPHPSPSAQKIRKAAKKAVLVARLAKSASKGGSMFDVVRGAQARKLLDAAKAEKSAEELPTILAPIKPRFFSTKAMDDHRDATAKAIAEKGKQDKLVRKKQKRAELQKRWKGLRRGSLLDEKIDLSLLEEKPQYKNCKTCKELLTLKEATELYGLCGKCAEEKSGFMSIAGDAADLHKQEEKAKARIRKTREDALGIGMKYEPTRVKTKSSKAERLAKIRATFAERQKIVAKTKADAKAHDKHAQRLQAKAHDAHELFKTAHYETRLLQLVRRKSVEIASKKKAQSYSLPKIGNDDADDHVSDSFRKERQFALAGFRSQIAEKRRDEEGAVLLADLKKRAIY